MVMEDFPLKVCQVERAPNLLSGGAFVRKTDALFSLSLLILFFVQWTYIKHYQTI